MESGYQDLIADVSESIADRLLEDAGRLEDEHAYRMDEFVFQLMMQIGLAALQKVLNRLAERKVEQCRGEGMHIWKNDGPISHRTKLGEVSVSSPYLRNPHTGQTARPMKDAFGVEGNAKSQALERALSDFGSEESYAGAEERFEEHYGFRIGRTSILRATNRVGDDAEDYLEQRLRACHTHPPHDSARAAEIVVQLDGCAIRTGEYTTARRAGLTKEDGYEPDDVVRDVEWKEVRVGLVRRVGEVTKHYVAKRGEYDDICEDLRALARDRGLGEETQVISPGDGGHGLKEAIEEAFPGVQFILDFSHLRDHFFETAEALGVDEQLRNQWVDQFLDALWEGQTDEVLERLRTLYEQNEHARLERLIDYLERFSDCVDYAAYEEAGWPTGSGEVESSHKYIPQDRLKLPGACWDVDSINPMLAIRVIKKNGWWDDFWDWRTERQREVA